MHHLPNPVCGLPCRRSAAGCPAPWRASRPTRCMCWTGTLGSTRRCARGHRSAATTGVGDGRSVRGVGCGGRGGWRVVGSRRQRDARKQLKRLAKGCGSQCTAYQRCTAVPPVAPACPAAAGARRTGSAPTWKSSTPQTAGGAWGGRCCQRSCPTPPSASRRRGSPSLAAAAAAAAAVGEGPPGLLLPWLLQAGPPLLCWMMTHMAMLRWGGCALTLAAAVAVAATTLLPVRSYGWQPLTQAVRWPCLPLLPPAPHHICPYLPLLPPTPHHTGR